jgi:hypothetical protein
MYFTYEPWLERQTLLHLLWPFRGNNRPPPPRPPPGNHRERRHRRHNSAVEFEIGGFDDGAVGE